MSDVVVFAGDNPVQPLREFKTFTVLNVEVLQGGTYLVIAKLVIQNRDRDAQNASALLRRMSGPPASRVLDQADVRIGGKGALSIALQAVVTFEGGNALGIAASTFQGTALSARLAAIRIDKLNPPPEQ